MRTRRWPTVLACALALWPTTSQGSVVDTVRRTCGEWKAATTETWSLQRASRSLRKTVQAAPETEDYVVHDTLMKAAEDRAKLLQLGILSFYARALTPLMVVWKPQTYLPDAFLGEKARQIRADELREKRRACILELVGKEEDCQLLRDVLSAPSKRTALERAMRATEAHRQSDDHFGLRALPDGYFHATSRGFQGPWSIMPKWNHVGAIRASVRKIADADAALRRTSPESLPTDLLEDVCVARSIPIADRRAMIADIHHWLDATERYDDGGGKYRAAACQARVALLGINEVSMLRSTTGKRQSITKLLYSNTGF